MKPSPMLVVAALALALVQVGVPGLNLPIPLTIPFGGTGETTATPAFDALAPTTTQGDVIYHNGTDNVRLGPGTNGQVLTTSGAGANPSWGVQYIGFNLSAGDGGGHNPAANTTYTVAFDGIDPSATANPGGIFMPFAGTINRVYIRQYVAGTNGVNGENITYRLRKNDTTNSGTVATLDTDADITDGSTTTLNFAVSAGDQVAAQLVTPASWTTPPTVLLQSFTLILETP